MWPDLIAKAKEGGLDVIQTYVFWNLHEPQQGQVNSNSSICPFLCIFFLSSLITSKMMFVIFLLGFVV